MADFLLELLTEEIPARMQAKAADQLRDRVYNGTLERGLIVGEVVTFVTPRRLVAIVRDVAAASAGTADERRGPRADAPDAAVAGFLKSTGLTRDQLEERDTPKGRFLYATITTAGRPAAAILAELIPAMIRDFDWPKSMRWGAASVSTASARWVRPLSGIVALLGDDVVACEAAGLASGRTTFGHRFLSSGPVEIASAATYADQLRDAHVVLNSAERAAIIVAGAEAAAAAAGLTLINDGGLVAENAGLTEWPAPLLGRFDPAFLDVPREVIQLTMRTNQKYFACIDADGALAPAFIAIANRPDDAGIIVTGNAKVLAARLSDAKFFWDADRAVKLEDRLPKLETIVFHEKLGTVADKVERVAKLARWLVESGAVPGADADMAEQAARLCKADLVSATVGEFPEVQGIAGGHLALAEGFDPQVAAAIRDHYKPVGPSDDVPTAPVTVAVALADKLDSLVGFIGFDERPTGSRDPFALRRAALGFASIVAVNALRFGLNESLSQTREGYKDQGRIPFSRELAVDGGDLTLRDHLARNLRLIWAGPVYDFLADRLKVQQREAGIRPDVIDAVFSLGREDDLVRLVARAKALQAVILTSDGASLLAGYRRGANIVRIEQGKTPDIDLDAVEVERLTEPAEVALNAALDEAVPAAAAAVAAEDFTGAMTALARLRPMVDAFFEHVTVNAHEQAIRRNRLALLARLRTAVHSVADFSKLQD